MAWCQFNLDKSVILWQDPRLAQSGGFVLTTSPNPEDKAAAYEQQVAGYIYQRNGGEDFVNGVNCLAAYQALGILPNRPYPN